MLQVSVVIVSYQSAGVIAGAVDSALAQEGVELEVIVVDNASKDESVPLLRGYGDRIVLVESSENLGFGRGVNVGCSRARGGYVFMLNPDARIDARDGVARLCRFLEVHPEVGAVAPRLLHPDGTHQAPPRLGYPGQRHVSADFSSLPGEIAWVLGAAILVRKSAFDAIGGFDPAYFLYGEETDLCLRLRKAGHAIGCEERVTVTHIGGASEAKSPSLEVWMRRQAGLHLFYEKSYPAADAEKLIRRERLRARYRLLLLGVKEATLGLGPEDEGKVAKYRAMRAAAEQSLARRGR